MEMLVQLAIQVVVAAAVLQPLSKLAHLLSICMRVALAVAAVVVGQTLASQLRLDKPMAQLLFLLLLLKYQLLQPVHQVLLQDKPLRLAQLQVVVMVQVVEVVVVV